MAAAFTAVVTEAGTAHAATGYTLLNENFAGGAPTDPNFKVGGNFMPCLTASQNQAQPEIPGCAPNVVGLAPSGDTAGNGALRLTDNAANLSSYILWNKPGGIPSTSGLDITFDSYQYDGTAADGISFFLSDGSVSLDRPGGGGGSIGYAQRNTPSLAAGLPGGYLGIALDAFGNFANDNEGRGTGCGVTPYSTYSKSPNTGTMPNTVTLRGPGDSGQNGYCWLSTNALPSGKSLRQGGNGTALGQLYRNPPAGKTGAQAVPITAVRTHIIISQGTAPTITLSQSYDGGVSYTNLVNAVRAPTPIPSSLKFGFASGTGGQNDVHEVRNLVISTLQQLPVLDTTLTDSGPFPSGSLGSLVEQTTVRSTSGVENQPVAFRVDIPAGFTIASAIQSPSGYNCSATVVGSKVASCTYSPLGPVQPGTALPAVTIPVKVDPAVSGASGFTATAQSSSSDSQLSQNNIAVDNLTVTPVAVNDGTPAAPVATVPAGGSVVVDVLSNDKGALNPSKVVVTGTSSPATTTVDPTTGKVTYLPGVSYSGPATFTYTVTDTSGQVSPPGTVYLNVTPVAVNDTATTRSNTPVSIAVLSNDKGLFSKAGTTVVTQPSNGRVVVDPLTGNVVYTPSTNFSGVDSFTYIATDTSEQQTAPATVTVTVDPGPAPVAMPDTATTQSGVAVTVDELANDTGILVPATVSITGLPTHGTATVDPVSGKITYTPAAGYLGTDSLAYTVKDIVGRQTGSTVTITVTAVPAPAPVPTHPAPVPTTPAPSRPPVAVTPSPVPPLVLSPQDISTRVGHSVTVGVIPSSLGSATGIKVTPITYPGHGTVVALGNGQIRYIPLPGFVGTDSFRYSVTLRDGRVASSSVNIRVVADAVRLTPSASGPVAVPRRLPYTGAPLDSIGLAGMITLGAGIMFYLWGRRKRA